MNVVILCGGLGTRIREETEFRPKPMVNIGPRPILWHIMKLYAYHGFNDFILALGYKGEMIRDYFCHYELMNNDITVRLGHPESTIVHNGHEEAGWKVLLANTGETALKGARLKRIEKYIDGESFMMTYGDGLSNVNIPALLEFHKYHGKIATVTGINPPLRFGRLQLDGSKIIGFKEKPNETDGFVNGGFFVFDRKVFSYLSSHDSCDLENGPLQALAADGELMVFHHKGFWSCMDTLNDMNNLNKLWADGNAQWKTW